MGGMIVGSIASAIVIGNSSYSAFILVNIGFMGIASIFLLFLTKPISDTNSK
jgi:hypothetical protein